MRLEPSSTSGQLMPLPHALTPCNALHGPLVPAWPRHLQGWSRSDILVTGSTPQLITENWEVSAADVQWNDAMYPLAQEAMRRGYYLPNRNSIHCSRHHCPYWRRCEQDFGGV